MNSSIRKRIILDLVKGVSINNVCMKYKLSKQELSNILKDIPLDNKMRKEIIYDGDLFFDSDTNPYYTLHGVSDLREIHLVVSADYHIGNIGSNISYAYVMADYMKKESIHTSLILGDLIDGEYVNINARNMNLNEQLAFVVRNFPMDPYINHYLVLGNHERHSLKYGNLDIAPILSQSRVDFMVMGYGYQVLQMQNDSLHLEHKLCDNSYQKSFPITNVNTIILLGHSHELKFVPQKFFKLYVLPMSDLYHADYAYYPGFLDLMFNMNNKGKIVEIFGKEVIVVDNKAFINNEFKIDTVHHITDYKESKRILKRKV